MTNEEMAEALKAAGWRVSPPLTKENCDHPHGARIGSGSLGGDGSSSMSWSCRLCGKHESWSTPADPNRLQNSFQVWS